MCTRGFRHVGACICPETDSPAGLWILAPPGSQEALFHLLSLVFQGDPVAQVIHFHPSRNTSKIISQKDAWFQDQWSGGGGSRAVKQRFYEVSGWQRRHGDATGQAQTLPHDSGFLSVSSKVFNSLFLLSKTCRLHLSTCHPSPPPWPNREGRNLSSTRSSTLGKSNTISGSFIYISLSRCGPRLDRTSSRTL